MGRCSHVTIGRNEKDKAWKSAEVRKTPKYNCIGRQRESPMSLILVPKWHGVIVCTPHRKGVVRCKSVNATNKRDGL